VPAGLGVHPGVLILGCRTVSLLFQDERANWEGSRSKGRRHVSRKSRLGAVWSSAAAEEGRAAFCGLMEAT
jgi:hypothetical protein